MENQENNKQLARASNGQLSIQTTTDPLLNLSWPVSSRANTKTIKHQTSTTTATGNPLKSAAASKQPSRFSSTKQTSLTTHQMSSLRANTLKGRQHQQQVPPAAWTTSCGGAGAASLMRRPYVRFDDYLDLNEENMRRSCKRLMNHLYSPGAEASSPAKQQHQPPVISCKVAAPQAAPPVPPPKLPASGSPLATGGASLAPTASGKSYLRSQYELRQLRQLELLSKMKQRQQLTEAPLESAAGAGGAATVARSQQASGRQSGKMQHQQQQQPGHRQQDLVARSHELSKQRFFERLERRKSTSISRGSATDATATQPGFKHTTSLNQMSAAAAAANRQQVAANNNNRQKSLDELEAGHRRQPMLQVYQAIVHGQHLQKGLNESTHSIDECQSVEVDASCGLDGATIYSSCRLPEDASIECPSAKAHKQLHLSSATSGQLIGFYSSVCADNKQQSMVAEFSQVTRAQQRDAHEQVNQFVPASSDPAAVVIPETGVKESEPIDSGRVQWQSNDRSAACSFGDAATDGLLVVLEPTSESGGEEERGEIYGDNKMEPMMQSLNQSQSRGRGRGTLDDELEVEERPGETMEAGEGKLEEQQVQLMHLSAAASGDRAKSGAAVSLTISSEIHDSKPSAGELIKGPRCETTGSPQLHPASSSLDSLPSAETNLSQEEEEEEKKHNEAPESVTTQAEGGATQKEALLLLQEGAASSENGPHPVANMENETSEAQQVAADYKLQTTTITNRAASDGASLARAELSVGVVSFAPTTKLEAATFSQLNESPPELEQEHELRCQPGEGPYANSDAHLAPGRMHLVLNSSDAAEWPEEENNDAARETGSRDNDDDSEEENIVLLDEQFERQHLIESFESQDGITRKQSQGSSLVDDDEATSSCGSSGFGASVSVTSSGSISASAKPNLNKLLRPTAHSTSSSPVDHHDESSQKPGASGEGRLHAAQLYRREHWATDDELFGYKRLVGPDQSYPPLIQQQQHHLVENHNYASVEQQKLKSEKEAEEEEEEVAAGNIYVNLPRASDYGSYLSANKMQARDKSCVLELADNGRRRWSASPSLQSYSTSNETTTGSSTGFAGFSGLAPVQVASNSSPDSLANSRKNKSSLLRRFGCLVSRAFTTGASSPTTSTTAPLPEHQQPSTLDEPQSSAQVKNSQLDQVENNNPGGADGGQELLVYSDTHHHHYSSSVYAEAGPVKQQDLVILPTKHVNQHQPEPHTGICRHDDRLSRAAAKDSATASAEKCGSGARMKTDCCRKLNTLQNSASSHSLSFNLRKKKDVINDELSIAADEDYGYLKKDKNKNGGCRCCTGQRKKHSSQLRGCVDIDCIEPEITGGKLVEACKQRSLLRLFTVTSSAESSSASAQASAHGAAKSTPNLATIASQMLSVKNRQNKPALAGVSGQKTSGFWGFSSLVMGAEEGSDGTKSRRNKQQKSTDIEWSDAAAKQLHLQHHSLSLYQHHSKRRPHHQHSRRQHHHHHHHRNHHHSHSHSHHRHSALETTSGHFRSLQLTQHQHQLRGSTKRSSKGYCSGDECSANEEARVGKVNGQLVKINKFDESQLIELRRTPGKPWGFFVARGSIDSTKGIFISRMHDEATSSALAGLLSIGDRILAIDECQIEPDCDILRVNQMISKKSKILLKVKPFKG